MKTAMCAVAACVVSVSLLHAAVDVVAIGRWLAAKNVEVECRVVEEVTNDWTKRQLSMKVVGKRRTLLTFSDADSFVAMMPTADHDGNLVTIWAGASAYHIRVWSYLDGRVSLVLEVGSRFLPELLDVDGDGVQEVVITTSSLRDASKGDEGVRGSKKIYEWRRSSARYVERQ